MKCYSDSTSGFPYSLSNEMVSCEWEAFSSQLLSQWGQLTPNELEATGHQRHDIAALIEYKYGINAALIENYLFNLERTLPLLH